MSHDAEKSQLNQAISPEENFEVANAVLDAYADSFHISTSLYSSHLYFGASRPGRKDMLVARLKVSPPMLKAMSILLSKHVEDYERSLGAIGLPKDLTRQWGLEEAP